MSPVMVDNNLEKYLKNDIFPQVASPPYGVIESTRLSRASPVYAYRDIQSQARVVGKYFGDATVTPDKAWQRAETEFNNLKFLREAGGIRGDACNIVAPLGKNKENAALLVIEFTSGADLDHYIGKAISENRSDELFHKLTMLAGFFARLHSVGGGDKQVTPAEPAERVNRIVQQLIRTTLKDRPSEVGEIRSLTDEWWNRKHVFDDRAVIIHGDATTTNFIFQRDRVTGIDLEDMRRADRTWDLGFIAAELKHHFMWRAGDGWRAEQFIGHFLWEYGKACNDTGIFYRINSKLPLFMAIDLLRIARNDWLSQDYRLKLVKEAKQCLKFRQ
jgi:Ser/Thr protein kinase RdoA (MazF antagonist)